VFIERVLTMFREVIEVSLELSGVHNFAGLWHFGIGATGLRDAGGPDADSLFVGLPRPAQLHGGYLRAGSERHGQGNRGTSGAAYRGDPRPTVPRAAEGEPSAFTDPA
jgi:hypothetical protein